MLAAIDPFWGVVVTVVPGAIAAVAAVLAARRSGRVNDSVNHRHPGEPRLLDIVKDIQHHVRDIQHRVGTVEQAMFHHLETHHDHDKESS